jgi:thiol-disulfide isomerase/thioredoxin
MQTYLKTALPVFLVIALLGAWYWYKQPKFVMGETAPDFSFQNLASQTVRLSELRGKYVLLQFWGSWCGPCRKENPGLVYVFDKFHSATFADGYGFEIVSIGMESNPEAWRKAIKKDGMIWVNHYTDLQQMSGVIAKQFRVTEIPTTYLLDPKGIIIGVNRDPHEVEQILERKKER